MMCQPFGCHLLLVGYLFMSLLAHFAPSVVRGHSRVQLQPAGAPEPASTENSASCGTRSGYAVPPRASQSRPTLCEPDFAAAAGTDIPAVPRRARKYDASPPGDSVGRLRSIE